MEGRGLLVFELLVLPPTAHEDAPLILLMHSSACIRCLIHLILFLKEVQFALEGYRIEIRHPWLGAPPFLHMTIPLLHELICISKTLCFRLVEVPVILLACTIIPDLV